MQTIELCTGLTYIYKQTAFKKSKLYKVSDDLAEELLECKTERGVPYFRIVMDKKAKTESRKKAEAKKKAAAKKKADAKKVADKKKNTVIVKDNKDDADGEPALDVEDVTPEPEPDADVPNVPNGDDSGMTDTGADYVAGDEDGAVEV